MKIISSFNLFILKIIFLLIQSPNPQETTSIICSSFLKDKDYKFGKTKIFLKDHHDSILESIKNRHYTISATIIQKNWKRKVAEKRFVYFTMYI